MELHFNYRFLSEFLKVNTNLNKSHLMKAIKTKDYTSVNRYINGEITPPIEHLLRISNCFGIPLSAWFFNQDSEREVYLGLPIYPEYATPIDGFNEGNANGGRKHLSPVVTEHIQAFIPQMATTRSTPAPEPEPIPARPASLPAANSRIADLEDQITDLHLSHEKEIDRIKALHERDLLSEKKRHKKALKEAADRHAAERLQLIDIIKAQQETINRLTRGTKYQEPEQIMQIAAEPDPEPQA